MGFRNLQEKIENIVFHFLFLSFQAYTIKRSTGVQSSVNRSMPDIGAVSPKIDRRGIKIVHPEKVDVMNLGHKLSEMLKKNPHWRCRGLNPGPFTCKANALPLRYIPFLIKHVRILEYYNFCFFNSSE